MNTDKTMTKIDEQKLLAAFIREHGSRVRRTKAMMILGIQDSRTFKKVVDANPGMCHRLNGEGQTRYLTAVIFGLLPAAARCATNGEEI